MPPQRYPIEPDRNDQCLCGSGRKFKKCCASVYRDLPQPSGWREAFGKGDFDEALRLLRAEMCRYAIWHNSHTVPWLERDPDAAEQLLAIDILALGDYLSSLQDCYEAAGIREEFPGVLDRSASLIADHRWGHQILLQRTYWTLGAEWDRARGKELLDGLDLDEVTDAELVTVYLDVYSADLSAPETLDLCGRILRLTDEASYRLHYSVLKGILWIFLGEEEAGLSTIEEALQATEGADFDTSWGKHTRIGALQIVGVHRNDQSMLAQASEQCREILDSGGWSAGGRAALHQVLGDIAVHNGKLDDAVIQYRESLELDGTSAPVRISLARCYVALEETERAEEIFADLSSADLDEAERVDLVLAQAGLLFHPHSKSTKEEIRRALEALEPRFPIHREARDKFLRHLGDLGARDSRLASRLKEIWRRIGDYLILQPNIFGMGVDLKALGDTLLGTEPADTTAIVSSDTENSDQETA